MKLAFLAIAVTIAVASVSACAPSEEQLQQMVRNEQRARTCNAERADETSWASRQVTWFKCGAPDPSFPATCETEGNESQPQCKQWAAYKFQSGQTAAIAGAGSSANAVIISH